jgi:hypothetical protein
MQSSYNDAHAKLSNEYLSDMETPQQSKKDSDGKSEAYGEDGWQYPTMDCPQSQQQINQYNQSHKSQVEKKYQTMVKNIYFYLCYTHLELNDYAGCIRNGNELLKRFSGKLLVKTEFTVK